MNETLSDEELKKFESRIDLASNQDDYLNGSIGTSFYYYEMQKALNTIEALKTENEHLKSVMLKQPMNFELEAKDAQIKQLVEALEKIENYDCAWTGKRHCCHLKQMALTALSTIPDVESYGLEREVLEAAIERTRCTKPEVEKKELINAGHALVEAVYALEAHREKVKSEH